MILVLQSKIYTKIYVFSCWFWNNLFFKFPPEEFHLIYVKNQIKMTILLLTWGDKQIAIK